MRNRLPFVALGLLTAVTVGLMVMALLHVRPERTTAQPAGPPVTFPPATSSFDDLSPGPSPGAKGSASPGAAPDGSAAPRRTTVKELLSSGQRAQIVVIGDASGADDRREPRWVSVWAKTLAEKRPVNLYAMQADGRYSDPQKIGPTTGEPIDLYNASDRPGRIADVVAGVDKVIPPKTDVVVFNFGHAEKAATLPKDLTTLHDALPQGTMSLVISQNPESSTTSGQQERVKVVARWAEQNRLPVINVNQAFVDDAKPLAMLLAADGVNPSPAGAEVWARTMQATLTAEAPQPAR